MKKYTIDDIQLLTSQDYEKWLLSNPERIFRRGTPNYIELITGIITNALILKTRSIQIKSFDDWWIVSSDSDWLLTDNPSSPESLFERLHAFPEGGSNSCRIEFILKVFANDIVIADNNSMQIIKGEAPEGLTKKLYTLSQSLKRLIAFRILDNP